MAIDKFGSPYAMADDEAISRPTDNYTPITTGASSAAAAPAASAGQGISDAGAADLAGAGVGAASTAAKSILNSIAAQNAIDFAANQGQLNRDNQGAIGAQNRLTQAKSASMHTARGSEGNQLQAGSTQVDAALGGQGLSDKATNGLVDRLAQLMSGNTKKRFGA